MMENRPPLTSPDGSSSRNSPERCPSPLYSWNSMLEHHKILRCYQYKRLKHIKTEVKEEAEETYLRGDELCKEEERSPEISTAPGGTRVTPIKAEEEEEGNVKIEEEKIPLEISTESSRNRNSPERCSSPLYSRDSTKERQSTLRCYQSKKLKHITTEMKEDAKETFLKGDGPCKEEEIPIKISTEPRDTQSDIKPKEDRGNLNIKQQETPPEISTEPRDTQRDIKPKEVRGNLNIKQKETPPEISTDPGGNRAAEANIKAENEERCVKAKRNILEIGMDGRYRWYNTEKHPAREIVDDDITAYVAKEKARTENLQPVRHKEEKPYPCPECGKRFTLEKYLIVHYRCHSGERPFFCAECGKSFSYRSSRDKHKVTHTTVGAFPCPECGKRFRAGWILAAHVRVHSGENGHR